MCRTYMYMHTSSGLQSQSPRSLLVVNWIVVVEEEDVEEGREESAAPGGPGGGAQKGSRCQSVTGALLLE